MRGLLRIQCNSHRKLQIKKLVVSLQGTLQTTFLDTVDSFEIVKRFKTLCDEQSVLLEDTEIADDEFRNGILEIPFEIDFPLYEPLTQGVGPAAQLLPASSVVVGMTSLNHYEARTDYCVEAVLTEYVSFLGNSMGTLLPFTLAHRKCTQPLTPMLVYDPRLIPLLMFPDPRRWRSSPGADPVEYDVEVGSIVLGPGEPVRFAYRIMVSSDAARRGVRIQSVAFTLVEKRIIGEDRCCSMDDRGFFTPLHKPPARIRGIEHLLNWQQNEYCAETETDGTFELVRLREPEKSLTGMRQTNRPGMRVGAGDGIYAEDEVVLHIPSVGGFTPSTPRLYPLQDYPCPYKRPRDAFMQVQHTLQVNIHLLNADKIAIESGVFLSCIGRSECARVHQEDPEILPTLDYDKVVGIQEWVPEYTQDNVDFLSPQSPPSTTNIPASPAPIYIEPQTISTTAESPTKSNANPNIPPIERNETSDVPSSSLSLHTADSNISETTAPPLDPLRLSLMKQQPDIAPIDYLIADAMNDSIYPDPISDDDVSSVGQTDDYSTESSDDNGVPTHLRPLLI